MKNAVLLSLHETVLRTILKMNKYRAGASDRNMTCTCFFVTMHPKKLPVAGSVGLIGNSYFNVTKSRGVFVIIHENIQRSNKSEERT